MKIFMCVDAFHAEEGYGIIKRGFEALGHEVYFYGVMFHMAETFKDSKDKQADINMDVIKKMKEFKTDIFLCKISHTIDPVTIEIINSFGITTCYYSNDDPHLLLTNKNIGQLVTKFQHIFTCCEGSIESYYKKIGCNAHYWLTSIDPEMYYKDIDVTYDCDIAFLATNIYPKEVFKHTQFQRKDIINKLLDNEITNIKLYGVGQEWFGWLSKFNSDAEKFKPYYQGFIKHEEAKKAYSNAKICLNSHVNPGKKYLNERTFEIMACGSLELCDNTGNLEELFDINNEIVLYNSLDELVEKIKYYLNNEEERNRIATNGMNMVRSKHNNIERIKEFFACLNIKS